MTLSKDEKTELSFIALLALLSSTTGNAQSNVELPELLHALDGDAFLTLVKTCPGMVLRIPTHHELVKALKVVLYYQEVLLKGKDKEEFLKEITKGTDFKKSCHVALQEKAIQLQQYLKDNKYKIPEKFMKTDLLKSIQKDLLKDV